MMNAVRLAAGILFIAVAITFQFALGDAGGIWINFALACLIALAFTLDFKELLFAVLFAAYCINWQPGISPELLFFILLPLAIFLLRKSLPLEPWIGSMFLVCAGILLFYSVFGPALLIRSFPLVLADTAVSLLYSALVFKTMTSAFPDRELNF